VKPSTTWIRSGCCVVSATEHNCFDDRTGLLNRPRMLKIRRVKNKHRPKTERHGSPASGSDGEGVVVSGKRRARPGSTDTPGRALGSAHRGGIGGLVAPISGRTLPPTAVQRAKPMDIRAFVLLIETSCLYSPRSEGKSRRAVRPGGFPRPPVIAICKIVVCR